MSDSILFWNDVALETNRRDFTKETQDQGGPTLDSRALAIVHLAMYDAYASIIPAAIHTAAAGSLYLPGLPAPPTGASAQAAVAGAAHTTLSALYPSQESFLSQKLSEAGDTLNPGHHFGVRVARAILQDRAGDPDADDTGYVSSFARGYHREDPDNPSQGYHAPFYGARSRGFAIKDRHVLEPPPFVVPNTVANYKPEYEAALQQVRGLGIAPELMGTLPGSFTPRSAQQTLIGLYWAYDGGVGLGTPPRLYNQIVRRVAMNVFNTGGSVNTEAQNALLLALVNAAIGDAGILAWDQKYCHDFWRPVIGIREHGASLGLATQGEDVISGHADPGWLPLGAPATNTKNPDFQVPRGETYPCNESMGGMMKNFTPNFPAYPSGHATFGAAALHMTRLFYGVPSGNRKKDDKFAGQVFVSDELNGVNQDNRGTVRPRHVRSFPRGLWQMIIQNGRSRVFLGLHWVFDAFAVDKNYKPDLSQNIGGVPLGLKIAEDIFTKGLTKSASPRGQRTAQAITTSESGAGSDRVEEIACEEDAGRRASIAHHLLGHSGGKVGWASSTEAAIREKRYFKTSESKQHTLAELIDRYICDVIPGKGAWAHDQTVQLCQEAGARSPIGSAMSRSSSASKLSGSPSHGRMATRVPSHMT